MIGGLFDALGLPEIEPIAGQPSTGPAAAFRNHFREGMGGLNQSLQQAAASLAPAAHQALASDRGKLFEAYQQTQSTGADEETMQRVLAAAGKLGEKAASAAKSALDAAGDWAARESEFDDIALQVAELTDAGHPKSGALQKLVDAIRQRVGNRQFSDCLQALDKLAPKLADIAPEFDPTTAAPHAPHAPQSDATTPTTGLATLEVHVEYQGTPVPGAMVRLSTGPTSQPDATTDGAGVAYFRDIEPGAYHVNAAKQAFVFQPVHVADGQLTPGATLPVHIRKAAQGNPPAPGYLYTGGGVKTPPMPAPPTQPVDLPGTTPPIAPPGPPTEPPTGPPVQPSPPGTVPPQAIATVEVHVIDENGDAVQGATVRVSSGPINPPDGHTDAAGIVRFQLVPGEYHINAAKLDKVWQPAHIAPGALKPGATYPVRLSKPILPKPEEKGDVGSLTLRVYGDPLSNPLAGAIVDIDGNPKFSTTTSERGVAQVDNLPVGPHAIRVAGDDPKYGSGTTTISVQIEKDKNLSRKVDVKLGSDRGSICVWVKWEGASKDYEDSDVHGAIVTLNPASVPLQVTDHGFALFSRVPFGVYSVAATIPQTGQVLTVGDVELNKDAKSRDVTMLARRTSDPTETELQDAGELDVEVRDEGSRLLVMNATVSLSSPDAPVLNTGNTGSVLFRRVPAGNYEITAIGSDAGETSTGRASTQVRAGTREHSTVKLSLPKGDLRVMAFDMDTGQGIQGVHIMLEPRFGGGGVTDDEGYVYCSDLPPGDYKVRALSANGEKITISTTVEAGKQNKAGVMMKADEAPPQHGTIIVQVMGASFTDVQYAVVTLTPTVAAPQLAGKGVVKFEQVPFGEYQVEASLENQVSREVVELTPQMGYANAFLMLEDGPQSAGEGNGEDVGDDASDAAGDMADGVGDLW